MKKYKFTLSLVVWLLFKNSPVFAALEPYTCRNGFFPKDQKALQIAEVNSAKAEKLRFYNDEEGCPNKTAQCQAKAYVIKGDMLIVNAVKEGWACAWFQGKKHETVGWVEASQLSFKSNANINNSAWLGNWQFYDNSIKLSQHDNKIQATGEAFWYGPIVEGAPVVHTGELEGELRVNGNHAHLSTGDSEYDCSADFSVIGEYLVVADNGNCGGANVSFSGVYTRVK